jgi:hypothetical protein
MSNNNRRRQQMAWNRAVREFDEHIPDANLYYVNRPAYDLDALTADAEQRAYERGCRCDNGQLRVIHLIDDSVTPTLIRSTFFHDDPQCPLHAAT